jgi:hypothetical protein
MRQDGRFLLQFGTEADRRWSSLGSIIMPRLGISVNRTYASSQPTFETGPGGRTVRRVKAVVAGDGERPILLQPRFLKLASVLTVAAILGLVIALWRLHYFLR